MPGLVVGSGYVGEGYVGDGSAAGLSATVSQVVETDSAQAITWAPKIRAAAQALETDLAQIISRRKTAGVAQASESDAAQGLSARKTRAAAQVAETDLAQAVSRSKTKALSQPLETDLAQAVARLKAKLIAKAAESDLAQPVTRQTGQSIAVAQVVESDVAQAITPVLSAPQQPAIDGPWRLLTGEYPKLRRRGELDSLPKPAQTSFPRVEPAPSIHLREVHTDLRVLYTDREVELAFREGLAGELVAPVGPRGTSPARADEEARDRAAPRRLTPCQLI